VLAGLAIAYLFAANVEQRVRADLDATLTRLAAVIDPATRIAALTQPLQDPRYETPFGGLYWQVTDLDLRETARSRSLWDFALTVPNVGLADGTSEYVVIPGPGGQTLLALARRMLYRDEGKSYLAVVAEDRAGLAAAIGQFGRELAVALALLGIALIVAASLQVSLGLRPLNALRAGIERVRAGKQAELAGDFPSEVQPLVVEVNDLLRSQAASIAFARARASDLAHGLKTPLAVLATTSFDLRAKGDPESADVIDQLAADMADRVEYQLRLSRLRVRTRTHTYSASVNDCLERVVAVLRRTRAGEDLSWDVQLARGLAVDVDAHDLVELLGVVFENAAKWGRSSVTIRGKREGETVVITAEDDGPGLPPEQLQELGKRGQRFDETQSGTGLGLAIATEIVGLNNGTIEFQKSGFGGLAVWLRLPAAATTSS
jgi:signal transduction histidine kinase